METNRRAPPTLRKEDVTQRLRAFRFCQQFDLGVAIAVLTRLAMAIHRAWRRGSDAKAGEACAHRRIHREIVLPPPVASSDETARIFLGECFGDPDALTPSIRFWACGPREDRHHGQAQGRVLLVHCDL